MFQFFSCQGNSDSFGITYENKESSQKILVINNNELDDSKDNEFIPVILKNRTPGLSYDDSVFNSRFPNLGMPVMIIPNLGMPVMVIDRSLWDGIGFNPEGPTGLSVTEIDLYKFIE